MCQFTAIECRYSRLAEGSGIAIVERRNRGKLFGIDVLRVYISDWYIYRHDVYSACISEANRQSTYRLVVLNNGGDFIVAQG